MDTDTYTVQHPAVRWHTCARMSAAECKHGFGPPPHMPIYSPILLSLHREVKIVEIWRGEDLSIAFERRDGSCAGFNVQAVPVGAGVQPGNNIHTFTRTAFTLLSISGKWQVSSLSHPLCSPLWGLVNTNLPRLNSRFANISRQWGKYVEKQIYQKSSAYRVTKGIHEAVETFSSM
jgi:hypothetical protein